MGERESLCATVGRIAPYANLTDRSVCEPDGSLCATVGRIAPYANLTDRSALRAPAILRHSRLSRFPSEIAPPLVRGPVNNRKGMPVGKLTIRGFLP